MKRFHRNSRMAMLGTLLTVTGLAFTAGPISSVHAATHPHISAAGGRGVLSVGGTGFTPNGTVQIQVRHYNQLTKKWNLEINSDVTALGPHFVCRTSPLGPICYRDAGGEITAEFVSQDGYVRVVADDLSSDALSNTARTQVYPIP